MGQPSQSWVLFAAGVFDRPDVRWLSSKWWLRFSGSLSFPDWFPPRLGKERLFIGCRVPSRRLDVNITRDRPAATCGTFSAGVKAGLPGIAKGAQKLSDFRAAGAAPADASLKLRSLLCTARNTLRGPSPAPQAAAARGLKRSEYLQGRRVSSAAAHQCAPANPAPQARPLPRKHSPTDLGHRPTALRSTHVGRLLLGHLQLLLGFLDRFGVFLHFILGSLQLFLQALLLFLQLWGG